MFTWLLGIRYFSVHIFVLSFAHRRMPKSPCTRRKARLDGQLRMDETRLNGLNGVDAAVMLWVAQ